MNKYVTVTIAIILMFLSLTTSSVFSQGVQSLMISNNTGAVTYPSPVTFPKTPINGPSGLPLADTSVTNGLASTNYTQLEVQQAVTNGLFKNVLLYGVVNDGVTDNTTALNNLLSTNGSCWYFPQGRYLAQELQVTNNVQLIGNGAVLVYKLGASNTNIFFREGLNTNIVISGMAFDGQQYPNITAGTNTWYGWNNGSFAYNLFTNSLLYCFGYWQPYGLRHGLQINIEQQGEVDNVAICGFNGVGLLPLSINGTSSYRNQKVQVTAANIYSNFVGLWASYPNGNPPYIIWWQTNYVPNAQGAEYQHYSQLTLVDNVVGMDFYTANSVIENSSLNENWIAILDCADPPPSGNNNHCIMSGLMVNHNIYTPLFVYGVTQGDVIRNSFFAGDAALNVVLNNCTGITIEGCMFQNAITLSNSGSIGTAVNIFRNNTYTGTWAANVAPNIYSDGRLLISGNVSYDTYGDNDGSPLGQIMATNWGVMKVTNAITAPFFNSGQVAATNGFASFATNQNIVSTSTTISNSQSVNMVVFLTAATGLSMTNGSGGLVFSGQTVAALTPFTLQPKAQLVGTAITCVGTNAW